ncbi:MAG: hypothetical protein EOP49_26990 [Sphingobacteriales bacterium]|nr:MAG: hypothetical protein EOP49_26990 [Sphingobacteriales bacterium]
MTITQRDTIMEAWALCDASDVSTQDMLVMMAARTDLDFDTLLDYLTSTDAFADRDKWYLKQMARGENRDMAA